MKNTSLSGLTHDCMLPAHESWLCFIVRSIHNITAMEAIKSSSNAAAASIAGFTALWWQWWWNDRLCTSHFPLPSFPPQRSGYLSLILGSWTCSRPSLGSTPLSSYSVGLVVLVSIESRKFWSTLYSWGRSHLATVTAFFAEAKTGNPCNEI